MVFGSRRLPADLTLWNSAPGGCVVPQGIFLSRGPHPSREKDMTMECELEMTSGLWLLVVEGSPLFLFFPSPFFSFLFFSSFFFPPLLFMFPLPNGTTAVTCKVRPEAAPWVSRFHMCPDCLVCNAGPTPHFHIVLEPRTPRSVLQSHGLKTKHLNLYFSIL